MAKVTWSQLNELANMGVGTSVFQLSKSQSGDLGTHPSQWDVAALKYGTVPTPTNHMSVWDTFEHYLPILAQMGIKKLRFSVEWNYIQPKEGYFNLDALSHYQRLIHQCQAYGIEPMLTLYHFTQPMWFYKKGGFENEANIADFVGYCTTVFKYLYGDVKYWCTINEPSVEALLGYILGLFPPHRRLDSVRAGMVLKNLLKAHVDVCHQLESELHGKPFYIGLVHNTLQFNSSWFLIRKWITEPLTYLTHELVMHFLETGQFQYRGIDYKDTRFKGNCCFINIYGDVEIGLLGPTCRPDQRMGDMHLALNPDSYARALVQAKRLKLPIYITETGIADNRDLIRPDFIIQFLRVVLQQLKDGMDIKALFFWTFKDNYEWHRGNHIQFGLFDANDTPKNSAHLFSWITKQFQAIVSHDKDALNVLKKWGEVLDACEAKIKANGFESFLPKV